MDHTRTSLSFRGLMLYTRCTAHDGHGGRCGKTDICTLVRTFVKADDSDELRLAHEHRVCFDCRQKMGLPELDIAMTPAGTFELVDA
jgi:hypothetical protein